MIEIIIERWTQRDGRTHFMWSLWQDSKRAAMSEPHQSADDAETAALAACRRALKREPDRVTRL
jgi:hypothetical protein